MVFINGRYAGHIVGMRDRGMCGHVGEDGKVHEAPFSRRPGVVTIYNPDGKRDWAPGTRWASERYSDFLYVNMFLSKLNQWPDHDGPSCQWGPIHFACPD